jgi:Tfp pilus assembly protein FimT
MIVERWAASRGPKGSCTQGTRGQSLVELALVMPVLALLVIGALDLGRVFYADVQLTNSVREGAIYARMNPTAISSTDRADPENIKFKVQDESELVINDGDVTVTCYVGPSISSTTVRSGTCQQNDIIEVTARARFQPITTQLIRLLPSQYYIRRSMRTVIP